MKEIPKFIKDKIRKIVRYNNKINIFLYEISNWIEENEDFENYDNSGDGFFEDYIKQEMSDPSNKISFKTIERNILMRKKDLK